jgi:biotin operon repressor
MKQPYSYSMPEAFLRDQSVPARWRLLGIMNGFFINGKPFYGSNEWLKEKLNCSEQTISNAMAELEQLGEVRTVRTRRSRIVYRELRDPNQLGSETQVDSSRDPSWLGTNSVSNSVSNSGEAEASQNYTVVVEEPEPRREKKPARKVTPEVRAVFDLFGKDCYQLVGIRKQEVEAAIFLNEHFSLDVLKQAIAYIKENEDGDHFFSIHSPYDLRIKWKKLKAHKNKNS